MPAHEAATAPGLVGRAVRAGAIAAAFCLLAAASQLAMGRLVWCRCRKPFLWSADIWSSHNSQHLFDAYTFSHVQHGVLFFACFFLLLRGAGWLGKRGAGVRFTLAMLVETAWEVIENTPWVIERYREQTISLEYYGDTVLNSLADILACAAGYGLAALLPVTVSAAAVIGIELVMLLTIRDSLALNVIMLVWPLDAIKTWQIGGR